MGRCRVDESIKRVEVEGFAFPLGAYPVEPMQPKPGYTLAFESADGDDSGADSEWEEWPDRYVFDILVSATRVESMCRALLAMLPGRVYPILDVLGHDAFREVDPYVSYELLGLDRLLDTLRRYRGYFFEDGLVGFGAMSDEPFLYIFVDEHKIVTVRCETELKERVEALMSAFDLKEIPSIAGADSATHEHRAVLDAPDDRPDLLTADEIVEQLRDDWRLALNIDPDGNVDDSGNELGITGWRCLVRYDPASGTPEDGAESAESTNGAHVSEGSETTAPEPPAPSAAQQEPPRASRYADVFLTADSLNKAIDLAFEGFDQLAASEELIAGDTEADPLIVASERMTEDEFASAVKQATGQTPDMKQSKVWHAVWLA